MEKELDEEAPQHEDDARRSAPFLPAALLSRGAALNAARRTDAVPQRLQRVDAREARAALLVVHFPLPRLLEPRVPPEKVLAPDGQSIDEVREVVHVVAQPLRRVLRRVRQRLVRVSFNSTLLLELGPIPLLALNLELRQAVCQAFVDRALPCVQILPVRWRVQGHD